MKEMKDLSSACQKMVKRGLAERVGVGEAIRFIGPFSQSRWTEANREYGEQFDKRLEQHKAREREAERKLHDFVIY